MQKYYTLFTAIGLAKIANAQITQNKIDITEMAFGDALGVPYTPTGNETQLVNEVWRTGSTVELSPENPNLFEAVGVIPADVGGFTICEVGLYDVEGDLIAIGNYPVTPKTVVEDGSIMDLIVRLVVESSNIETINMTLDPTIATASRKYVAEEIATVNQQLAQTDEKIAETSLNAIEYNPNADGNADDTLKLQKLINDAANRLGVYDKKIKVNLGNKQYKITGLTVPRGVTLLGDATLIVNGVGNIGLKLYNSLHASVQGIKIMLTAENQIGIDIDSPDANVTASQLNEFKNVWVTGQHYANTIALRVGKAWVNNFYSCKFFECADGVQFTNAESNSNLFYGCEIRGNKENANSKLAILQIGGKGNAFIGGVIENYKDCIDVRDGDFKMVNVYTEAFGVDRAFTLRNNATLSLDHCLVKSKFRVVGGNALRVTNCDMSRGGFSTNANSPMVQFYADTHTTVLFENNDIPSDLVHCRYGTWFDNTDSTHKLRSAQNRREKYLDRDLAAFGALAGATDVTGDGTTYDLTISNGLLGSNPYGELNTTTGHFTPITNGVYEITIQLQLEGLDETHTDATLLLRERGTNSRQFTLDTKNTSTKSVNNRLLLQGSTVIQLQHQQAFNFAVRVSGVNKMVGIRNTIDTSDIMHSYFTIKRIA